MLNYAIGHYSDVDGVLSHALLERASIARRQQTVHLTIDYKDMLAPLREIDLKQAQVVRIFDLGYNQGWENPEFVRELKRIARSASLEIYDHHEWPDSSSVYEIGARRIVVPIRGDKLEERCTTEIISFLFAPGDQTPITLSQIANNSDFMANSLYPELSKYTRQLELVVAAANKKVTTLNSADLVHHFATLPSDLRFARTELLKSEFFWPESFHETRKIYNKAIQSAKQGLGEDVRVSEIQTAKRVYSIVIGFAPQILHMKGGVMHLQEIYPDHQIYACIYDEDNSIIFSSDTGEINVAQLGKAFDGGGRASWSGGFLPKGLTAKIGYRETTSYYVLELIKETLTNIS